MNIFGIPIQVTHRSQNVSRDVDWAVGANMAFRKEAAIEVGGLSEVYGIYDEDVDFGLRLKKAGYRIVFEPHAAVYHYFMQRSVKPVTKKSEYMAGRNRSMLLTRNYGFSLRLISFLITAPIIRLLGAGTQGVLSVVRNSVHFMSYMAGIFCGIILGIKYPVRDDKADFDK